MKIALTGTGEWLDPSTHQLQFKLQNEQDFGLYVIGQPHSFIRRARLLCGGTVVEDIDQYNRVHEMLSILSGRHNRDMDDASSVSQRWDSEEFYKIVTDGNLNSTVLEQFPDFNAHNIPGTGTDPGTKAEIKTAFTALVNELLGNQLKQGKYWRLNGNHSKVVSTKLAFGLLNQPKWIPLRYAPLTLELELVNSFADVIITQDGTRFEDLQVSKEWSIQQVEVKCDVCTLDNALENSYEAHLLDKGTLPINYNTYINQSQNISGQVDIAINVSRANS